MIKISNVVKSYKSDFKVLKGITLDINDGDLFAFIGHNGAGKTTLIKCMTGILNFQEGQIKIFDKDIVKQPLEAKKLIAYVPDNPDVYEFMTGSEFINFVLNIYGVDINSKKDEIISKANMYEIEKDLNKKISEYSHGMKQKLVLISAFVRNAKVLILDEPFVGLDPKASKITKDYMKEFCSKGNIIFFSTHVLETAEKLCNKVAIIKDGVITHCGNMAEIIGSKTLEETFLNEDE